LPIQFSVQRFATEVDVPAFAEAAGGRAAAHYAKAMTKTNADQADILAQFEQATADLNTAKQTIATLQSQITSLTTERDSAKQSITALTQERDTLKAENDRLKSDKEDFSRRLAAELAKHGIRNAEASAKVEVKDPKKLTATERLLAAKGIGSLEELEAKRKPVP
jgi:FtsZ-binding cell division protein ZapB